MALFGVAVCLFHHLGLLGGLGNAGGGTQWADWLDLLTPFAVVGTALWTLAGVRLAPTDRAIAFVGAVLYTCGHGIHLAANSIGNARGPAAPVHLWDETVGHALWYGGLALLVIALARVVRPRANAAGWLLAAGVGLTWGTNGLGADGLVVPMLLVALGLAGWGWRRRAELVGWLLQFSYGLAAAVLALGGALG